MPTTTEFDSPALSRLHDRLTRETRAEVYFDRGRRGLYATDASLYQIEPLGVVVPRTVEDVVADGADRGRGAACRSCRGGRPPASRGRPSAPAIVIDFSKYLNRIGVVDRDAMTVRVEPGVVLDQLNAHLKPLGLMFGPDVSTSDRATIGGMIGNNSAGARSLRYGKTVDHVRAVEVVLADGTPAKLGPALRTRSSSTICRRDDPVGRVHRVVRDTVAEHRQAIIRPVPPHPPAGERLQPRRVRAGPAGAARGLGGGALAVQPGEADRRRRGDAGRGDGRRPEGGADPAGPGAGRALVRHDPRGARPAGRDRGDRAGGRRDARPDDPRPGRRRTRSTRTTSTSPRAGRRPSWPPSSTPTRRTSSPRGPTTWPGGSRAGRACSGVRKSLTDAAKDDFWKVRKAGFSLLMAMVGDAKPIAFVEDTAVDPDRLPEFYDRFEAIVARHGVPAACYGHADVGCLHIRPIINVKTHRRGGDAPVDRPRGLGPGGRVRRRDERRARRRPGPQPLEPQALRARGLRGASRRSSARSTRRTGSTPTRSSATPTRATTSGSGPIITRASRPSTLLDFSGQGGFARAVEMCSGVGRLPQDRHRHDVPQLHGHARRDALDPRPRQRASAGDDRRAARRTATAWPTRPSSRPSTSASSARPARASARRRSTWPSSRPSSCISYYGGGPRPLSHLLMGQIFRLNPIGSATRPAGQRHAPQPALQVAAREGRGDRPAADPADLRPRPLPEVVPPARGRSPSRDARGGRPARRLLHDVQQPRGRHRGGPGAGGGRLPRSAGGPALLRPAGDLQGAADARPRPGPGERRAAAAAVRGRACRSSAASRAAW